MKYLIVFILFSFALNMQAQEPPRSKEDRIKAVKIAFITEELNLTPEESQGFWPIYNEMEEKHKEMRKRAREDKKPDFETMSDAEVASWLDEHIAMEEAKVALHKEYIQKFKKVIPVRKIAKLLEVEHKFKKELLRRMQEHRGEHGPGPGGRGGRGR